MKEVKKLPELGWDFQCHTHTHPHLSNLTDAEIRAELEKVNESFQAAGLPVQEHHTYPYGDHNATVKSIVTEYRKSGRTASENMETYPVPDWFELKCAEIRGYTSWSTVKGWVDQCIASNALLTIFTHRVVDPAPTYAATPAILRHLADYLVQKQDAGQLTVMTMKEAYDYWSTATEGKATVVFTFDGVYKSTYTKAYPIFKALGLKATVYIITGWVGQDEDSMTWEEINNMRQGL